jgi:hypothetical protein
MISKWPKARQAAGNSAAVRHESQGRSLWITALRTKAGKEQAGKEQRQDNDKKKETMLLF